MKFHLAKNPVLTRPIRPLCLLVLLTIWGQMTYAQPACATDTLLYTTDPLDSSYKLLVRNEADSIPCLLAPIPVDHICGWYHIPNGNAGITFYGVPPSNHVRIQIFQDCNLLVVDYADTMNQAGYTIFANFQNNTLRICADSGSITFYRLIPTSQVPGLTPFLNIDTLCGPTSIAPPTEVARDPGPWIDMSGRRYDANPPAGVILYDVGKRRKIVLLE